MKKVIICLIAFCYVFLVSCRGKTDEVNINNANEYDWGVALRAENVTTESVTLICTQSGGGLTGELNTGEEYFLEVKVEDNWEAVPTVIDNYGWDSVAYIVNIEGETSWDINWSWIYGKLEPGEYRIGKEFMDFRETANYDTAVFYAEFEITE